MEMSQFGKSCLVVVMLLTMVSFCPTTAMAVPVDLNDIYPDMSIDEYCRFTRDNRMDKRNNELIHNLDRMRGLMNMG